MDTSFDVIGENMIITMDSELDHHNAEIVRNMVDRYIFTGKIKNIIFDFENTTFMDSSGIGVIVGRYKLISPLMGKISVINVNGTVDRILLLSGLYKNKIVSKKDNLEDALNE